MIVKWVRVKPSAARDVVARLSEIREAPPDNVPKLAHFGLSADGRLRIETFKIDASDTLASCGRTMAPSEAQVVFAEIARTLRAWSRQGFVHGDLSPRNILVERPAGSCRKIWFVDWSPDLDQCSGTPLFVAPSIRRGLPKTLAADAFAAARIIEWCRRERSVISPF